MEHSNVVLSKVEKWDSYYRNVYKKISCCHSLLLLVMRRVCFTGRAALQKRIMPMLRKIEEPTQGNKQAWVNTFTKLWKKATDFLKNFPNKGDGGIAVKRRAPNQTSEYELDVRVQSYMLHAALGFRYLIRAVSFFIYSLSRYYRPYNIGYNIDWLISRVHAYTPTRVGGARTFKIATANVCFLSLLVALVW